MIFWFILAMGLLAGSVQIPPAQAEPRNRTAGTTLAEQCAVLLSRHKHREALEDDYRSYLNIARRHNRRVNQNSDYYVFPMLYRHFGKSLPSLDGYLHDVETYFKTPPEQTSMEITIKDGLLYGADGQLFDSQGATQTNEYKKRLITDRAIFVMNAEGKLFAIKNQIIGVTHHTGILAGLPVAGAGEIGVRNGRIIYLSDKSGHYPLPTAGLDQVLRELGRDPRTLSAPELSIQHIGQRYVGDHGTFYQPLAELRRDYTQAGIPRSLYELPSNPHFKLMQKRLRSHDPEVFIKTATEIISDYSADSLEWQQFDRDYKSQLSARLIHYQQNFPSSPRPGEFAKLYQSKTDYLKTKTPRSLEEESQLLNSALLGALFLAQDATPELRRLFDESKNQKTRDRSATVTLEIFRAYLDGPADSDARAETMTTKLIDFVLKIPGSSDTIVRTGVAVNRSEHMQRRFLTELASGDGLGFISPQAISNARIFATQNPNFDRLGTPADRSEALRALTAFP